LVSRVKKTNNVPKRNNQGAMRALRDKGKLVMNEKNSFKINLTSKVELEKNHDKIELESKKRRNLGL